MSSNISRKLETSKYAGIGIRRPRGAKALGGAASSPNLKFGSYQQFVLRKKPSFARRFARASKGVGGAGGSRTNLSNPYKKRLFNYPKNLCSPNR